MAYLKRTAYAGAALLLTVALAGMAGAAMARPPEDSLERGFLNPPESAKPHTWWHWINGNVTREGITADLEAMKRVGIGGAQIFNVDCGITPGPVKLMSPEWRALTRHAAAEASRLGIELCIHNCGGWSSSGGPWNTPANAMKVVVTAARQVSGPGPVEGALPQPPVRGGYYKDIAVLAYPAQAGAAARIANLPVKVGDDRADNLLPDRGSAGAQGTAIARATLLDLTSRLDPEGRLSWQVPAGEWTLLRVGYTLTEAVNAPATPEATGLECDKLSKKALDAHWAGMMKVVIGELGPLAGKTLNNALIDSYERGCQNWTPRMAEEFRQRRGYDPVPFLPTLAGQVVDSTEVSERFLWDLRRTVADLWNDNYYGHFAELCHQAGMVASAEAYGNGIFDDLASGGRADIPMGEFWVAGGMSSSCKLAASSGHTYGRPVIGAESFTAVPEYASWRYDPYSIKALGDLIYCLGINRFIFHRYAHQPWLDRYPGMTMGPWGTNFERTNTWWEQSAPWMRYLARCQYLLQQGRFAADVLYFCGESAPNSVPWHPELKAKGYDYDGCNAETLMRLVVRGGRLALPGGMAYRVLVLPDNTWMTPQLAAKVRELVRLGAIVIGPRPERSPSLAGYPGCDAQVQSIGHEVWGNCDGKTVTESAYGKGRVAWGRTVEQVLRELRVQPDFTPAPGARVEFIHRLVDGADVYFVSNQRPQQQTVDCTFRAAGRMPELWSPDTGAMEAATTYRRGADGRVVVPLTLDPAGSVFVVFRRRGGGDPVVRATYATGAEQPAQPQPTLHVVKAVYEAVDGTGGADVTAAVAAQVQGGTLNLDASNSAFGDPTPLHVKRLRVEYVLDGKPGTVEAGENEHLEIGATGGPAAFPAYALHATPAGRRTLTAWSDGVLEAKTASGRTIRIRPRGIAAPTTVGGPWTLAFPAKWGAPPSVQLDRLISWTDHEEPGVRYFSGTAAYTVAFELPGSALQSGRCVSLDLGRVKNLAQVRLNGTDLGVLWKPPFRVDITSAARAGTNRLEVRVTNLWPNRLIGDAGLPPEKRVTFATWSPYKADSPLLESGLLGPVTVHFGQVVAVPTR